MLSDVGNDFVVQMFIFSEEMMRLTDFNLFFLFKDHLWFTNFLVNVSLIMLIEQFPFLACFPIYFYLPVENKVELFYWKKIDISRVAYYVLLRIHEFISYLETLPLISLVFPARCSNKKIFLGETKWTTKMPVNQCL